MKTAQDKIRTLVEAYVKYNPQEAEAFMRSKQQEVGGLANKWAEVKGTDLDMRKLFEIPTTLYEMFEAQLEDDERLYWKSEEGGRWFARAFPIFRITHKV